jgi:hypothetical protein
MSSPVPAQLVLRKVPDGRKGLAAALAGLPPAAPGDVWWELTDTATPPGQPAAGVALTRAAAGGVTHVVTLAAVSTPAGDPLAQLLRHLVAALRRTDTAVITIRGGRADIDAVLLAEDFAPSADGLFVLRL